MDEKTLTAYLRRIGVARPGSADATMLRILHRAHQMTVPFENLSIHLAEPISLDPGTMLDKIVTRRRGGFCYELNGAFALLLQALGAGVRRVAARVHGEAGLGPPLDHMALVVRTADGSGPWLADVGFGSHSVYPLLFDSRDPQDDPAGGFLLADASEADVEVVKDGQVSISGRSLIRTRSGARTEEQMPDDEAVLAAYRDHFGIILDRVPTAEPAGSAAAQPG